MTKYVSVLEEWDDIVGDDWDHPDSNYLNPYEWLDSNPLDAFSNTLREILESAFKKANEYID